MDIAKDVVEHLNKLPRRRQRMVLELTRALAESFDDDDDPTDLSLCEYLRSCLKLREEQVADNLVKEGLDPADAIGRANKSAEAMMEALLHLGSKEHRLSDRSSLKALFPEGIQVADETQPELICTWFEYWQVVLARRVLTTLEGAGSRFYDLYMQTVCVFDLTHTAREFLSHVATCYLYGLDTECNIMCRSVLDVELSARIPADDCMDLRRPSNPGERLPRIGLKERVDAACTLGLISEEIHSFALEVVRHGDSAVHRSPKPTTNSLGLIIATLKVLNALQEKDS